MKRWTDALNAVPTRLVLLVMMFTMSWVNYLMRVNISVSIIAMVPDAPASTFPMNSKSSTLLYESTANTADASVRRKPEDLETFDWTSQEQAYVIAAYAWGYVVTTLFGGTLAEMWGPRRLVLTTMLLAGVLSLLSPEAAKIHYLVLVVIRTITGLLLGTQYPAVQALVAHWVPPDEKGIFLGVSIIMGGAVGTVFMWNTSGLIIGNLGWDYTFYIPGIVALLWCILWWFLVFDSPVHHPRISETEKNYILTAIGDKVHHNKKTVPPFKMMLRSIPFYAYVVLHFATAWSISFVLTVAPKYISSTLGFSLSSTGSLSSLPHASRIVFSVSFGALGDMILRRNWMKTTFLRKFFCLFSHIIPGLLFIALGYTGSSPVLSVVMLATSVGMNGAGAITNVVNNQDLAPNFAGTMFGIANSLGQIAGFVIPLLTGYFTKNGNSIAEWRPMFFISAAILLGSSLVFIIFGTAETQKWNYMGNRNKDIENESDSNVQKVGS